MRRAVICWMLVLVSASLAMAAERQGYYRFPTIWRDTIVFTSEGDLWSLPAAGGQARRLTSHPGMESNPALSPDGRTVAFSGQYEGPTEVYVMPVSGGLPRRLTWSGFPAMVVGWTAAGRILYATQKYSTLPNTQLVALDPGTGREELLPLNQAADGCYDAAAQTLFFTRLPFQGSYTKRYRGGTVQNLWRIDSGFKGEARPLTQDYPGTSKNPIWHAGRIYFLSDRDGTMNIWSMSDGGGDLRQHTFHQGLDASSPSLGQGRIVYQLVADLHLFDIAANRDQKLEITLASDFDQMREKWVSKPLDYLTSAHLSPSGDRVALTSRGQLFVAPAADGRFVRVTERSDVRHRSGRFLPDGRSLLALADESGEWEFHRYDASGQGRGQRLTEGARVIRFDGLPSPDGRWIAFADKDYQLWLYDLEKKSGRRIAVSDWGMHRDFAWSADGLWLAFVQNAANQYDQIMVCEAATGNVTALTSDRVDSYSPAWSPDGKWLYFLSDRQFQSKVASPWGARQPEPYFEKTTQIYALALTPGLRFPFLPADELAAPPEGVKGSPAVADAAKAKPGRVEIVFAGLGERIYGVPVPAGDYSGLAVSEKLLFWEDRPAGANRGRLQVLEIKNRQVQAKTLIEDISGFELSTDGKKILVRKGDELYVVDAAAAPPTQLAEKKIDLSRWSFSIEPQAEWRQMLTDAWRMERDYFYDRRLHGADYDGLLRRHLPYLARVSDRSELNDLIAHLVGELSALHTFVRGGDLRRGSDDVQPGSLGARLARDESRGGYRIERIYRADPDYPERLSPLATPQVGAREGDVITAINGTALLDVADPSILLRNRAGEQVLLELKTPPAGTTRRAIAVPITAAVESDLRYEDWEYSRRLQVESLGNGEIGYVHLRAMGGGNYTEWVKHFYPVFDRRGLIVDVRHNRGGNIDSWILEKLMRKAWFYWQGRVGKPTWNMQYAFRGHLVVLCDEYTASDGEAFAEGFRRLGLGKVIGVRTWGGEIWLSSSNVLVDRGLASAAETGVYGPEGGWLIEGHGVEPDILVDNPPRAAFLGEDAQLLAAIRHLQELIAKDPRNVPPPPPYPDKRIRK